MYCNVLYTIALLIVIVTPKDHIVYTVDIRLHGPQGQRRRGVWQWRVRTTVVGIISGFYALSGGFIAFTGICKVPVHVDLRHCKLIQNAGNDGDTCWGVFPFFEAAWVGLRTERTERAARRRRVLIGHS